jgi:hypothetical protein
LSVSDKPFENREHIVWEIGFCGRAATYFVTIGLIFAAIGVIGDLLNIKLGLGSTSWFFLAVLFVVGSMTPQLHMLTAKHLRGMDVIKKE